MNLNISKRDLKDNGYKGIYSEVQLLFNKRIIVDKISVDSIPFKINNVVREILKHTNVHCTAQRKFSHVVSSAFTNNIKSLSIVHYNKLNF